MKGLNGAGKARNGTIELLGPDLKRAFVTIYVMNVGIFKLSRSASETNAEKSRTVRADMYCERIGFTHTIA